jgi:hypothetical protein
MARTDVHVESLSDLTAALIAALVAAGWVDDGAPTATILKGAADTEGRRPYLKIYEQATPDRVTFDIGHGRSGDNVTLPGTMAANGAAIGFVAGLYNITTTDRWIFVKRYASAETAMLLGMLECPSLLADYTAPLFMGRNMVRSGAASTLDLMSNVSSIYVPDDPTSPVSWDHMGTMTIGFWTSTVTTGNKNIAETEGHFFRGRGVAGPRFPTTKWWILSVTEVVGYLKDVYVVYGLVSDQNEAVESRVLIGGRYYYQPSWDKNSALLTDVSGDHSIGIYLPGELA